MTHSAHQVLETLDSAPRVRKKYAKALYKMCGHYALLPAAMHISVDYDRMARPLYSGGHGDVWKGDYLGQEVAVKVLRAYSSSDMQEMFGVGLPLCSLIMCWYTDRAACRGSAKRSSHGKLSSIQMLYH